MHSLWKPCATHFFLLVCGSLSAQVVQDSQVLNSGGERSGGGGYTHIGCLGQPSGLPHFSRLAVHGSSGFLARLTLFPGRDADGDGIPDEVEWDNDGDALEDGAELAGSPFDPVTPTSPFLADSDSDGAGDGVESAAGTNPVDPGANLRLMTVSENAVLSRATLTLRGRAGRRVWLQAGDRVDTLTDHAGPYLLTGGASPWFFTTNVVVDAHGPADGRVYRLRLWP